MIIKRTCFRLRGYLKVCYNNPAGSNKTCPGVVYGFYGLGRPLNWKKTPEHCFIHLQKEAELLSISFYEMIP